MPIVQGKTQKTPYRAILSDPVFWGLFTSNTSGNTAFQIFWLYGPLYLNKVMELWKGREWNGMEWNGMDNYGVPFPHD
jgi:hypothetical protein